MLLHKLPFSYKILRILKTVAKNYKFPYYYMVLQSMGSQRSDTTERLHFHFSLSCIGEGNGNPVSSVLAWRIPGMGEPGGLPSMGSHRVGHD